MVEFKNDSIIFKQRVEAILHQLELSFKKHKPDFGLGLLNSVVSSWINDVDPMESLQVEKILNQFKSEYSEKGLDMFVELLNESLLSSTTPVFKFTMKPDGEFSDKLVVEENERLSKKTKNLTDEDRQIILERSKNLLSKQQSEEDVSVLPTLTINDIPRTGDFYKLNFSSVNDKKLQTRIVDTNGLIYATAAKDLSYLPLKYYPYMPLFLSCLTNLAGTAETSIIDLESKIQKNTGGINFSLSNKPDPFNIHQTRLKFLMSGMSLSSNSHYIYNLWHEILTKTKFNVDDNEVLDKLNTLIKNMGTNQMDSIAERGHSYAGSFTNSQLTITKKIRNITGGMDQVEFIMNLNKQLEVGGKEFLKFEVLPILSDIQNLIINGATDPSLGFEYNLIGYAKTVNDNEVLIKSFDDKFSTLKVYNNELLDYTENFNNKPFTNTKTLFNLPFQIGYASLGKLGSAYTSKDGASLQVLSQLLTFKHLHSVIRESNGAYGGGLNYDGLGGTLNFYSYRDPNPLNSVDSFQKSYQIALEKIADSWNLKDLQESKLSIFQSIDAPSNISSQGLSNFIEGIDDHMRQERREKFLDINLTDLKDVTEKYLIKDDKEIITVIGDNEKLSVGEDWNIKSYSN